ncbi:hypothetical protein BASA81_010377 [Batrachochytrium salamandrivorans]|nr:hypothetical protein BASA81_010377 [Batrachochytrium salamandrivorans]
MEGREFDLTVLGVTGFTGKLVVDYLDKLAGENKLVGVKICFAGRNDSAMLRVCNSLKHLAPSFCLADVTKETSVLDMALRTRVVLALVGPYEALGGEVVIKSCIQAGAHYVDVTGEGRWMESMKQKYHELAQKRGVCLVPFAGQDSVPADLTAWFTTSQLPEGDFAQSHATLQTLVQLPTTQGQLSNGTFKTLLSQPGWSFDLPVPKHDFSTKLTYGVQLVSGISPSLAAFPFLFFPDANVVRDSHLDQGLGGRFENNHLLVFPNRPAALVAKLAFGSLPYLLHLPYAKTLLGKLSDSGGKVFGPSSRHPNSTPANYVNYGVLKMYPLHSSPGTKPVETIVTRVDCDRDPYEVTAITCTQVALALLSPAITAKHKTGFQTPVSAVGGQELLERCFECIRVSKL